jgi:hypothetical protein
MNKEQIIDEVYKNYKRFTHNKNEKNGNYGNYSKWGDNPLIAGVQHLTKDSFIQMIKIDSEFSEKCGLKIEERELSLEERGEWDSKKDNVRNTWGQTIQTFTPNEVRTWLNEKNVPTKLITITYKNETIESYE